MSIKFNYITIPIFTLVIAWAGGLVTSAGLTWYETINVPSWTPPGFLIGIVWATIYILATVSALLIWNRTKSGKIFSIIMLTFILNGFLNFFWSYIFFFQHLLAFAVLEAGLLGLSVLVIILFSWPRSKIASLLLWPYFVWVVFATFLTYQVWKLN